jgi:hypothetical protein
MFPWSGSPKLDGISINYALAQKTVCRNMVGSIPLLVAVARMRSLPPAR